MKELTKKLVANLKKSIIGLPIGITGLLLAYIFTYIAGGNELFTVEIAQIANIEILVKQMAVTALIGYATVLVILTIAKNVKENDIIGEKLNAKIAILESLGAVVFSALVCIILGNTKVFTSNVASSLMILWFVSLFIIFLLYSAISIFIETKIIGKKINEKIKEKQANL